MTNWEGVPAQMIQVSDIMDDPMNPNKMDKEQLKALEFSLEKEDNIQPLVINKVTGMEKPYMVVNGHQRLKVLRKKEVKQVLCVVIEKPLDEARSFGLALNRNVGNDDPEKLANVLKFVFENKKLDLITKFVPQFDQDFIKLTIDKFHHTGLGKPQDEEIPPAPTTTNVKPGDMFQLGDHRIMCGDSTKATDVNKLIGKIKIQQLNTDPPYGVNYHGDNHILKKVNKNTTRHQFEGEDGVSIADYQKIFQIIS